MGAPPIEQVISDAQREYYEVNGYLSLESFVTDPWLSELRSTAAEFVERSRSETRSSRVFDLEPGHTSDAPRIRRLNSPVDQHDTFARFTLEGPAAELAQAVLGGPQPLLPEAPPRCPPSTIGVRGGDRARCEVRRGLRPRPAHGARPRGPSRAIRVAAVLLQPVLDGPAAPRPRGPTSLSVGYLRRPRR